MASPIQHHRAGGIHPGAFVQDSAPATTDVQDGVLWVDTSSGPPYQLNAWNQALGTWDTVGTVRGLPLGQVGDVLVHDGNNWVPLPAPPQPGQSLTLVSKGTQVVTQWQPCCADGVVGPASAVPTPSTARRCGAAVAMATTLEQLYQSARAAADEATISGTVDTLSNLVALIGSVITDGLSVPVISLSKPIINQIANDFLQTNDLSQYPILTTTQDDIILQAIFCAIPVSTTIGITQDVMDGWVNNLLKQVTRFHYQQLPLLLQLLGAAPAQAWHTIAYVGAQTPSGACAHYACQAGTALRGGAALSLVGHALAGGARLDVTVGAGLRGGAVLGTGGDSMQGGARLDL